MSNLWERFESIVSTEEVKEAKAQFTPLEAGDYSAILESIEPSESKNGLPMLKGKFKAINGGRFLFYNQMLQNLSNPKMTAINVAEAIEFVGGLLEEEVDFKGLADFANLIYGIPTGGIYKVNVSYGQKDYEMKFPKLKIIEKVAENIDVYNQEVPMVDDGDMPF